MYVIKMTNNSNWRQGDISPSWVTGHGNWRQGTILLSFMGHWSGLHALIKLMYLIENY